MSNDTRVPTDDDITTKVERAAPDAVYVNITGPATYPARDHHLVIHYNGMPVWDSDNC